MAMGRPSSFKPEYCKMLIEHMKQGNNYQSFCAVINKSIETLYNWEEQHKDFLDAKKEAFNFNQAWWQAKAIEALEDITEYENGKPVYKKSINPTVLIFNLKNRFPDQWRDVKQLDQKITQNINIESLDLALLTSLLLEAKQSEKIQKELVEATQQGTITVN